MGCGSRAGKMDQHKNGKPAIDESLCRGCRRCARECGSDAIRYVNNKAVIDYDKCKGCGRCIGACSFDAVYNPNDSANEILDRKMAEYAQAVCHGRPCFHVALVRDNQPQLRLPRRERRAHPPGCGHVRQLRPPWPSIRPAPTPARRCRPSPTASSATTLPARTGIATTTTSRIPTPNIEWKATLDQAEKIGLGSREYTLKKI